MLTVRALAFTMLLATSQCFPAAKSDGALKLDDRVDFAYEGPALSKRLDPPPPPGSIFRLTNGVPYYLRIGRYLGAAVENTEHDLEEQAGAFFEMLDDNGPTTRTALYDVPTDTHGMAEAILTMDDDTVFGDILPESWRDIANGLYTVLQRFGTWAQTSIEIYSGNPDNITPEDFYGTFTVGIPQGT